MIRMTKIVKMIGILLIIGLGIYVIVYLIIQSLFIDVNKIHNFQNIKDFEKYSHLSFYDLYDFDAFINTGEYKLLSVHENYFIHFEDYEPYEYIFTLDSKITEYTIHQQTSYPQSIIGKEEMIVVDDAQVIINMNTDTNECYFTVYLDDCYYRIRYTMLNHISQDEIISKIKDYVHFNNELHKEKLGEASLLKHYKIV